MAGKEDKKQSEENKLKTALLKKALGYEAKETIEEYVSDDGEIRLSKRKVTKKNVPPDITAIKMLLGESQTDITEMTTVVLRYCRVHLPKEDEDRSSESWKEI